MSTQYKLNVAVVADDPLALHHIKALLVGTYYELVLVLLAENIELKQLNSSVDVWLIELKNDSDFDWVGDLYSVVNVPILMGDGVPPQQEAELFKCWRKRTLKKLEAVRPANHVTEPVPPPATFDHENPFISQAHYNAWVQKKTVEYWVLAASMGGPDAVKTFLDAIDTDLPVCFIYAQHTNDHQGEILAQVLKRNNQLPIRALNESGELVPGEVVIVPTEHQVEFKADGVFEGTASAWPSPYAPNIDQVITNIANHYNQFSGVIVFSGMCDDGALGALNIHQSGGLVWAQSPETCISADMPNAVLEQNIVSFTGSPEELASRFMQHMDFTDDPGANRQGHSSKTLVR